MFIAVLTYVQPIEQVEALLAAHVRFLDEQYAAGRFLASGRRVPRTGGVILARGADRAEIEGLFAQDPFALGGVAKYEIIEFIATKTAPELEAMAEPPAAS
jgi:uncharacterized protein YciI